MKIADFLSQYPNIRLASEKDSEALGLFFSNSPMSSSSLQLSYERSPNFFTFLSYQGEAFVFCMENDLGQLVGVASLTVREGYIHGLHSRVGYLGDLRVNREQINKMHSKQWKKCMGDLIENIKSIDELSVDFLITVILGNNKLAKKALVNHPKNTFHYEKIADYKMVNILTTFGKQKVMDNINTRFATKADEAAVLNYLKLANCKKQFGYTVEFFKKALDSFNDFKIENFVLALNNEQLVGVTLFWNPSPVKKIFIQKLPRSLKALNILASLFTFVPKEKQELKVQYLSFLHLSKDYEQVIANFVEFFKFHEGFNRFHMLAFSDYDLWPLKDYLKMKVLDNTPLELYQVVDKNRMNEIIKLDARSGFEMSLV